MFARAFPFVQVMTAFRLVKNNKFAELEDMLIEGHVNVNTDRDDRGNSLLLCAAQNGLKRIAKLLLRKGADINARVNTLGLSAIDTWALGWARLAIMVESSISPALRLKCHEWPWYSTVCYSVP